MLPGNSETAPTLNGRSVASRATLHYTEGGEKETMTMRPAIGVWVQRGASEKQLYGIVWAEERCEWGDGEHTVKRNVVLRCFGIDVQSLSNGTTKVKVRSDTFEAVEVANVAGLSNLANGTVNKITELLKANAFKEALFSGVNDLI